MSQLSTYALLSCGAPAVHWSSEACVQAAGQGKGRTAACAMGTARERECQHVDVGQHGVMQAWQIRQTHWMAPLQQGFRAGFTAHSRASSALCMLQPHAHPSNKLWRSLQWLLMFVAFWPLCVAG